MAYAHVLGDAPILITGAGVSGLGTAHLLRALDHPQVVVADEDGEALVRVAKQTGASTCTSTQARAQIAANPAAFGLVVTSPGWRPDTPLLREAEAAGIEVIGDVELAYRLDRAHAFGPPRTWLVVTGTNGKTTTTGMLADIMNAHAAPRGERAAACGNIGLAVADALTATPRVDYLVAELSSFQLHWSKELNPDVGVLLNIAEDHLDWHGGLENYSAAKAKVLAATHAVAGADDPLVGAEVARHRPDAVGFSLSAPQPAQVGIDAGRIVDNITGTPVDITSAEGINPAGTAGLYDALAATAVARLCGVEAAVIDRALHEFSVAGHRGETVHHGRSIWIDNSKATNPHAADAALAGRPDRSVVWIAGGQLKGAAVDELITTHAHRFRAVGLLGTDRHILADALTRLAPEVPVFISDSSEPTEAMNDLVGWAARLDPPGETVLLAPAAASLDMYSGMAQRGDIFAAAARTHDHPLSEQT